MEADSVFHDIASKCKMFNGLTGFVQECKRQHYSLTQNNSQVSVGERLYKVSHDISTLWKNVQVIEMNMWPWDKTIALCGRNPSLNVQASITFL